MRGFRSLFRALKRFAAARGVRLISEVNAGQSREQALLLLMRYSGLAIRDAATLPSDAVDCNELNLRRAKTGELVPCELPAPVIEALERITRPGRAHFFLNGSSPARSVRDYW